MSKKYIIIQPNDKLLYFFYEFARIFDLKYQKTHMSLNIFISNSNRLRPTQQDIIDRYKGKSIKLKKLQTKLAELQDKIKASSEHAVLVIFQAMDAAGKDSTIRNVFRKCDIGGLHNVSFKQPSKNESAHDFIWRCHKETPKKGIITLFNRSYYEEVLAVKVHPHWLSNQGIEGPVDHSFWHNRYQSIKNFEEHLHHSGTTVIKFMLDVSQQEQHKRFIRRYATPSKQWKFSVGDIKESKLWNKYQQAFDDLLTHTSTETNPWHVIPADDKDLMRLLVCEIMIQRLKQLKPQYPAIEKFSDQDLILIDELVTGKI